ncbi:helix-turn-helix transcriptional regulator [Sphingobacterium sp. Mn56C]|uniref:helix-turn-helix transcriptional regulator n=1 Tax=Sphingobacterium sp. Mn56C TaxID=3395261 RepID=UPI003BC9A0AC
MKKESVDRILMEIKMQGEVTLAYLAEKLGMTKEGARQHLVKLSDEGYIAVEAKKEGVGRPTAYFMLTDKGRSKFPDTHAQITVDLLQSVKNLLGENALNLLISDREKQTYDRYANAMASDKTLEAKLITLTALRSDEGYLAEWKKEGNSYFFMENHCPICAAATECQGFCRAELKNFQELLGPKFFVDRTQHIISGALRCTYKITKLR